MLSGRKTPKIPLPRTWRRHLGAAVLQVISPAQCAMVYTRRWAAESTNSRNAERRASANRAPHWEPRDKWPRGSPCAKPWTLAKGKPGARLRLDAELPNG